MEKLGSTKVRIRDCEVTFANQAHLRHGGFQLFRSLLWSPAVRKAHMLRKAHLGMSHNDGCCNSKVPISQGCLGAPLGQPLFQETQLATRHSWSTLFCRCKTEFNRTSAWFYGGCTGRFRDSQQSGIFGLCWGPPF